MTDSDLAPFYAASLRFEPAWHQLNDETEFALAEYRFNRAHDAFRSPDRDPVTDLERRLASQVSGRNDLLTAPKLISIPDGLHGQSKLQAPADRHLGSPGVLA